MYDVARGTAGSHHEGLGPQYFCTTYVYSQYIFIQWAILRGNECKTRDKALIADLRLGLHSGGAAPERGNRIEPRIAFRED